MTTQSNITEIVPTERIEEMILGAHYSTPIALTIAWGKAVGRGSGNNVEIPRRDGVTTNAGTKAESAEFGLVNTTLSNVSVSGGWVGHSDRVSWEANTHGVEAALDIVVTDGVEAIMDRVDSDGLSIGAGATNSSSFSGAALTEANVLTVKAAFNAQRPHKGRRALVLYTTQVRDWGQDLIANGGNHLGGDAESQRVAELLGQADGFIGSRHKLALFESENVATAAGDATGFMCKMGKGGALAYRSWAPIGWEDEWEPRRKSWMVTIAANYGWVLSDQANIRGVVSRST